jgi:hypothetical protein
MMESRRGARIQTAFLVAIDGVDAEPTLRSGDISATGIYFETRREIGGVGTIHWLYLVSADRVKRVRAMAYVVRTVQLADAAGERLGGVALEFMPESDEAHAALHDFVRYVLALRFRQEEEAHIAPRLDAHVGGNADLPATVQKLSVRSMVLETSWAIQPGEKVRVDIVAPGMTRRIRLDGRAVRVQPKPSQSRFDIEVEVQAETERPIRTHSSMTFQAVKDPAPSPPPPPARASSPSIRDVDEDTTRVLDDLLAALILPPVDDAPRNRRGFLSGKLEQVRLPTLLSLIEMERMTGRLVLRRGPSKLEEACVFVSDGVVLDVEPLAPRQSRREKIASLVAWDDGTFELQGEPIVRENRVNIRTAALLLDIAREEDETRAKNSSH